MPTLLQWRPRMHQPSFKLHLRSFRLPVVVICLLLASLLPTAVTHAAGGVVYVKPGGTGNGSSWATAADLAPALHAATSSTQLWVAKGTYLPTTTHSNQRLATFALKNGVAIYGGFNGTETQLSQRNIVDNPVILSGDLGTANQLRDNSYHVVFADGVDATAILDGVTVTLGYADGPRITDPNGNVIDGESGGGTYNYNSSPTLANIIFIGNTAVEGGGGMFNYGSNLTLTNVVFTANLASGRGGIGQGGGMENDYSSPTLTNVVFSGNTTGSYGGGMRNDHGNPTLTNVIFSGNTAISEGGGMRNYYSNVTLINVLIQDNVAATSGGGIFNQQKALALINVTITGNSTGQEGGGISSHQSLLLLTNVLLAGNAASTEGGGFYNDRNTATLANTTITNNTAPQGSGIWSSSSTSRKLTVHNSIVWDVFHEETPGASDVQYSDVQGGYPGTGNLNADPRFVAPGSDYHLQVTSPVIDQGNNSFVPPGITKDLSGNPRIVNGIVDMGAYEYQGATTGGAR